MKVKAIQDRNFLDRKLKKRVMALKRSEPVPDDVTFHCRRCFAEVCQAHNIRRVKETYHVIISSDVRDSKVGTLSQEMCFFHLSKMITKSLIVRVTI